jgi:glycerol-3-phosphate dehydrogenase
LCDTVDLYFRDVVLPADVVWAFSGVRSLHDDGSRKANDVTRDYVVAVDQKFHTAPLLTIYGGKITTYRRLAESALACIDDFFVAGPAWTAGAPLPGGDFAPDALDGQVARAQERWPFLSAGHARRLVCAYGTRIEHVLGDARRLDDLGTGFGADLTAAEVRYMMRHEWAETADDVLWRRSKLGLRLTPAEREALAQFMAAERARAA